jgi:hypothetical protein
MKYVSDGSAATARSMERKFQTIPGVLLISVQPIPTDDGICSIFTVNVGMNKEHGIDESTIHALIDAVLSEELRSGAIGVVHNVMLGVPGLRRDKNIEEVNKTAYKL